MYNRFMSGMSNGGAVQTFDPAVALTNDELHRAVPSIFATTAHESRSDRFRPIPTINVIEGLKNEGFLPFFAQQANTRIAGKADYTKHVIRLRHASLKNEAQEAFEIILINANDGTSSYNMLPGFFRFVCMNGLFTGDCFSQVRVRHSGKDTIQDVIDGAYTVLETAPRVIDSVDRFKGIHLSQDESRVLAESAHQIRFPNAYTVENDELIFDENKAPIEANDLLVTRRNADKSNDLWTTFNRIQENTVKGGQTGTMLGTNGKYRRARVKAVKGVDGATKLNQALWTLTQAMADLKEPA